MGTKAGLEIENPPVKEPTLLGAKQDPRIALLLDNLDDAYNKMAWHGPNLRGAIRGVPVTQAVWRPHPKRHNITEIRVHDAYWKYAARRRLHPLVHRRLRRPALHPHRQEALLHRQKGRQELTLRDVSHARDDRSRDRLPYAMQGVVKGKGAVGARCSGAH